MQLLFSILITITITNVIANVIPTPLPSNNIWTDDLQFDGDMKWELYTRSSSWIRNSKSFLSVSPPSFVDNHIINGPYALDIINSRNIISLERWFQCPGNISLEFDYCHKHMEQDDRFLIRYKPYYDNDISNCDDYATIREGSAEMKTSSWGRSIDATSFQCGSMRVFIPDKDARSGYKISFDVSVNFGSDTFLIRDLQLLCTIRNTFLDYVDYDVFSITTNDATDSLLFGLETGAIVGAVSNTALKPDVSMVVYDKAGNYYICIFHGVSVNTHYECEGKFRLRSQRDGFNYTKAIGLGANNYDSFDAMYITKVFIASKNKVTENEFDSAVKDVILKFDVDHHTVRLPLSVSKTSTKIIVTTIIPTLLPSNEYWWDDLNFKEGMQWEKFARNDDFTKNDKDLISEYQPSFDGNHIINGPYALSVWFRYIMSLERWFQCSGELVFEFDYCHKGMEEGDTFWIRYKPYYDNDISKYLEISGTSYNILYRSAEMISGDYTYQCTLMSESIPNRDDGHSGYKISFDVSVNRDDDIFLIRDLRVLCNTPVFSDRYIVNYDVFSITTKDPSDSLLFGLETGTSASGLSESFAPKASVAIDVYDNNGAIYRCRFVGVNENKLYECEEGTDHVSRLSSALNPNNYKNKMALHAFEFDSMYIKNVFIASKNKLFENVFNIAVRDVDIEFNSDFTNITFDLTVSETLTSIGYAESKRNAKCAICSGRLIQDLYPDALNNIDNAIGIVLNDKMPLQSFDYTPIESPRLQYEADISECQWNEGLGKAIDDINPDKNALNANDAFDIGNGVGNALSLISDIGDIYKQGSKLAKGMGVCGNALMAINNIAGVSIINSIIPLADSGPTAEERTQTALRAMENGMSKMMECTEKYTDAKINSLRDELNDRIDGLQDVIQDNLDELKKEIDDVQETIQLELQAKIVEVTYKVHLENVEQEIAGIQDVLKIIRRQLQYVNATENVSEKLMELKNILHVTMPRFGGVIKSKPADAEFDYFWKLYGKEISIFIIEIITVRNDVWSMWLRYNHITSTDITPDDRLQFRDLNGELIGEYIELLPMAIYAIIVDEDVRSQLQRMKITDRFAEIDLRFKPNLICSWIKFTQMVTNTPDTMFISPIIAKLYNERSVECQSNIRAHIIEQIISIDNSRGGDMIYKEPNTYYTTDTFIASTTNYNEYIDQSDFFHINTVEANIKSFGTQANGIKGIKMRVAATVCSVSTAVEHQITTFGIYSATNVFNDQYLLTLSQKDDCAENSFVLDVKCSDGYVMNAIRFGVQPEINNNNIRGVKVLCIPIPKSKVVDDLYQIFTDYEIVSDVDPSVSISEYLEWKGCVIGTVITDIELQYHTQGTDRQRYLTLEMSFKCGSLTNFDYYDLLDDVHVYHFDFYGGSFDEKHDVWSKVSFITMIALIAVFQALLCVMYNEYKQKSKNKVEHFDQQTDIDQLYV